MNRILINFSEVIKNSIIVVFFLLFTFCAYAQTSLKSQTSIERKIYKLDASQFIKLQNYQNNSFKDSIELFTTNLIKSIPLQQANFIDSLPFGHFLAVSASGKNITFRQLSRPYFRLQSFGYNGEIWHIITDPNGNVMNDAQLTIKEKEYHYQADCNCYPVPANKKTDTLKISYLNHYDFYKTTANYNEQMPYNVESNTYQKQVLSNVRILPGYVAFNQPMYHKNDTIKVKAFLVNEKGRPWRKRKILLKYRTPEGKMVVLGKVKRQSEGAYVKDFVVSESFSLGDYQLSFWKTWDEVMLRSETFKILDYELKPSNTYAAKITQSVYHQGQNIEFILKAEDVNGLALLDAKASITIEAIQFIDYYDKLFFWDGKPTSFTFKKETLFDVAGETVVVFPDSLFPNTNMKYRATIKYENDLKELYTNHIDFVFDAKPNHIEFHRSGDSLIIDHFTLGVNSPLSKLKLISYRGNAVTESKVISAPYREKLDLFNTAYILKDHKGREIKRLDFNNRSTFPVVLAGKRSHNSIQIHLKNDLEMPVSYQVFKRDQKIDGGQWNSGDNSVLYHAIDSTLDDYHVIYSILWHGKHFVKEQIFYSDETKLNVDINQPEIVFPGSRVPIEVNITDFKNKGVEGANITAYSVNDLFESSPLPNLPYFGRLHKGFLTQFPVRNQRFIMNKSEVLTKHLINHFDLREQPYYNFVYAKNGVGVYSDSIEGDKAEIALYAHKMNNRIAIRAIYLNGEPVAIDGSSNRMAYVFSKQEGSYEVKLRTNTHLYTIKNIEVKAGERTYICLNEAFSETNPNVSYLKIDVPPFTDEEWFYVKSNFLFIKKSSNRYVLRQNDLTVDITNMSNSSLFYDNGMPYFMIGPLKKGKIDIYDRNRDTITVFDFYPGFLYSIDSSGKIIVDKVKPDISMSYKLRHKTLYSDWDFGYKIPVWDNFLPDTTAKTVVKKPKPIKEKVVEKEINFDNPARAWQLKSFRPQNFGQLNSSTVQFKNNSGKTMFWTLLVNRKEAKGTGAWFSSYFNYAGISPGLYDVVVLFTDSSYALISDYEVKEKGINFYRLDSSDVMPPDSTIQYQYEEVIVEANKSALSKFTNNPLYLKKIHLETVDSQKGQTVLSGFIVSSDHKPINQINLIIEKAGQFKFGALTNIDGYFQLTDIEPGTYTLKIGNYLPYHVYENLDVKRGANNRIVIGNDSDIRLNYNGQLQVSERIYDYQPEEMEYINNGAVIQYSASSPTYSAPLNVQNISAAPALSSRRDLQAVNVSLESASFKPISTITSTIFPNLDYQDSATTINVDQYANQKGIDRATLTMIRNNDSLNRIRDNFRDHGFWVPNLLTDKNGNVKFTVEFPDNITRWKTIVPAMTGDQQAGIGVKYAQAFKPLSAHLGMPSFLIVGDSIKLEGKILNYTNENLSANTWFKLNSDTLQTTLQTTDRSITEKQWLSWSKPADSLILGYGLKMTDGYLDGEERVLSVLTNGIEQIKGELLLLDKDSVLNIQPDGNKKSVYIYNKPLGIYETEINKLKSYTAGSNELTASKLKALVLEQKIAEKLNVPFKSQKEIKDCIDLLTRYRKKNGSYGWWGQSEYDLWTTSYILDALYSASKTQKVDDYMATARFLKNNLSKMNLSDRLSSLNSLAAIPFPMDYNMYIKGLDTINLSLQDEFKFLYLKQKQGDSVSIDKVLESFIKTPKGIYWGEQLFNGYINEWPTSALAYKILKQEGGHADLLTKMRDYFLQLNPEGRNSIERATLLELFLEDELLANETINEFKGEVWINDQKIESFPYYKAFDADEAINIRKAGTRVRVQANTHTITQNPQGNDSLLTVITSFEQDGRQVDSLIAGRPTLYKVHVNVKEDMKYVLLEIPVPATCIYSAQKAQPNRRESNRKEFRHQTIISCASLPKGTHQFQINLIPRYEGTFNVVPIKIQEQYFPVNANYSQARRIVISKR